MRLQFLNIERKNQSPCKHEQSWVLLAEIHIQMVFHRPWESGSDVGATLTVDWMPNANSYGLGLEGREAAVETSGLMSRYCQSQAARLRSGLRQHCQSKKTKRPTDIENKRVVTSGEREEGREETGIGD